MQGASQLSFIFQPEGETAEHWGASYLAVDQLCDDLLVIAEVLIRPWSQQALALVASQQDAPV